LVEIFNTNSNGEKNETKMEKHDYVANGIAVHEDGFKFTRNHGYVVIKHNDEEKAKLIYELIIYGYKFENNFTRDMLNCKYDCYNNAGRYIENKTPLNLMCQLGFGADILILIDKVDDFIGEYKYNNTVHNYEIDIQPYGEKIGELLINKLRQYKEDREKPNKFLNKV
jgi:hypothetical protein